MVVTENTRHLTASMVVLDPDRGSVLLIHHNKTGKWQFPGGHLDPDETPGECAVREVLEETGVKAVIFGRPDLALPGMVWHPSPWITAEIPAPASAAEPGWPAEPAHAHIDLLFLGTADSTDPTTAQLDEVHATSWVPLGLLGGNVRAEVPEVARRALFLVTARANGFLTVRPTEILGRD